jgi:hypothetical protein
MEEVLKFVTTSDEREQETARSERQRERQLSKQGGREECNTQPLATGTAPGELRQTAHSRKAEQKKTSQQLKPATLFSELQHIGCGFCVLFSSIH